MRAGENWLSQRTAAAMGGTEGLCDRLEVVREYGDCGRADRRPGLDDEDHVAGQPTPLPSSPAQAESEWPSVRTGMSAPKRPPRVAASSARERGGGASPHQGDWDALAQDDIRALIVRIVRGIRGFLDCRDR